MLSKSFGLPHFWLGAVHSKYQQGQGKSGQPGTHGDYWQNCRRARGWSFPFSHWAPPTTLQPAACLGALIGGSRPINGSDHGRCGPMGMDRTAALASTRASAEAPRASISHSTHPITVSLPREQPLSRAWRRGLCIVCNS